MLKLAVPTSVAAVVARLPVTPPSLAFCVAANRLLWPALQALDWQPLVGRRYAIRVKDLGLGVRFTVTARGFAPHAGAPELTVSATAGDFLRLLARREDPDTLFFSRRLVSEGDTELGLVVKNLLDALEPEAVLGRLPRPLAQAVQRMMAA
ncbi:ubiquinone anaerobic biosynthesis accessory factor UbiT [Thiobacillus sedimenti]|uniref:Ubiquinone biosynthesis accessory factor UbiT n=1 Tax=Thiobacillus sedimenti TaxID=3110231 RepID=A0ABZ1CHM2_9PROT|nr:SCP2 sterol-binding domain-containing protein [Thiobacillus sp. SCUT-2]WRS38706.1 SCP2 sterol-binding domain-containing protein [Thiobacillus sp. SCUT-2]